MIVIEYDVEWDDVRDLGEEVKEVLDEENIKNGEDNWFDEKEKDEEFIEEEKKR